MVQADNQVSNKPSSIVSTCRNLFRRIRRLGRGKHTERTEGKSESTKSNYFKIWLRSDVDVPASDCVLAALSTDLTERGINGVFSDMDPVYEHSMFQCVRTFFKFVEENCEDWTEAHIGIGVAEFITTLYLDYGVTVIHFLAAIFYMQKLCGVGLVFTQEALTALVLVCVMEADDDCPKNSFWASAGGTSLAEINLLECHLLTSLSFRLAVHFADLNHLLLDLVHFAGLPRASRPASPMARRFAPP
eukprot:CAMPEP_0113704878 /NCGR_PEP_ID=MMETSP0038_2-20120614/26788_1 /TAXON_ID=2898 /ORGANISM="Cryptomonas paramecium" /LENGTH=245 /DNA_ID=CAMNT_0000629757 /DNA_START=25 /DNA_END=758 /DNA_ORIENTATION=- /assembly_acc=CAM_ASM_000170